jgi:hypothetical protein
VMAMDNITKRPEGYASPTKRHRQWQIPWWPTSAASEYRGSYTVIRAVTSESRLMQELLQSPGASKTCTDPCTHRWSAWWSSISNGRGAPVKSRRIAWEGLGCVVAYLPQLT